MFNEATSVGTVVADLRRAISRVVCVDDGSTDDCARVAADAGATVVRHPINLGQGAALQTGFAFALTDPTVRYAITFDSDGQHDRADAERMLAVARTRGVDVVLGSRFLTDADHEIPRLRRLVLRAATIFTRLTTGLDLTDTHNGLRVLSRAAVEAMDLTLDGMAHASQLLSQVARKRLSVRRGSGDHRLHRVLDGPRAVQRQRPQYRLRPRPRAPSRRSPGLIHFLVDERRSRARPATFAISGTAGPVQTYAPRAELKPTGDSRALPPVQATDDRPRRCLVLQYPPRPSRLRCTGSSRQPRAQQHDGVGHPGPPVGPGIRAATYDVQVSSSSDLRSDRCGRATTANRRATPTVQLPGGTIHWRVRGQGRLRELGRGPRPATRAPPWPARPRSRPPTGPPSIRPRSRRCSPGSPTTAPLSTPSRSAPTPSSSNTAAIRPTRPRPRPTSYPTPSSPRTTSGGSGPRSDPGWSRSGPAPGPTP